jgi:hypothetical protein
MTKPFEMHGNVAKADVDVGGYTVSVTVRPKPGTTITTEDAAVIFTRAIGYLPHSIARFPEPFNRR